MERRKLKDDMGEVEVVVIMIKITDKVEMLTQVVVAVVVVLVVVQQALVVVAAVAVRVARMLLVTTLILFNMRACLS